MGKNGVGWLHALENRNEQLIQWEESDPSKGASAGQKTGSAKHEGILTARVCAFRSELCGRRGNLFTSPQATIAER
jgi:hypothetical protein